MTSSKCCVPYRSGRKTNGETPTALTQEIQNAARVMIPGGVGFKGTKTAELPLDGEGPLCRTKMKPFLMDQTAVTNARFRDFVEATGYKTDAERYGNSFVFLSHLSESSTHSPEVPGTPWWRMVEGAFWGAPAGPQTQTLCRDDHPVVHVTWRDAQAFAKWAKGRLPTEAEWEHAARGGLGDVRFPWGDTEPNDEDHFPCNIWQGRFPETDLGRDGFAGLSPAQSFAPNGYGLYNMVGNTWEYTSQPFRVTSLKKSVRAANAAKAGMKLVKGGSFLCHRSYCYRYRIAARTGSAPDSSTSHQGFRLVYDA